MAKKRTANASGGKRPFVKARGGGRRKKKGLGRYFGIAASIAAVIGLVLAVKYGSRLYKPVMPPDGPAAEKEIQLYVAADDWGTLAPRALKIGQGPTEAGVRAAIEALIKDPSSTLPNGTILRHVSIRGSTAFIDLSEEAASGVSGSSGEILAVYSIVNTVTLNFQDIKDVQILIEGKKAETLAGHIDISQPIPADKKLIGG